MYSGLTAAHVFARIELPGLVVVLAPNHTGICRAPGGASLWEAGGFETPLGPVAVDSDFATALFAASPLVAVDHAAPTGEHAVEVELPILLARRAARPLGATRATVVDYRHSGWVSGDHAAVVGYGGAIIT